MDKNFVNIDNLVRQRLGGGEEQEQSGSWLRMRELLDKEMPQEKRVGIMYWRRMFSALAALLLIGTISVGGYKLSANRNGNHTAASDVAIAPAPIASASASNKTSEISDNQLTTSKTPAGNNTETKNTKQDNNKLLASNSINNHSDKQNIKQPDATPKVPGNYETNSNELPVAEKNNSKENNGRPIAEKTVIKTRGNQKTIAKNNNASKEVATTGNDNHVNRTVATHKPIMPAAKSNVKGDISNDNKTIAATKGSAAPHNEKAKVGKLVKNETTSRKVITENVKTQKMETLALGSHAVSPDNQHVPAIHKIPVQKIATPKTEATGRKALVNSHAVIAKKTGIAAVNMNKVIASKNSVAVKKASAKNGKKSDAKIAAAIPAPGKDAGKTGNQPQASVVQAGAKAPADNASIKQAFALNTKKDKKVIQKLILYAHYINTAPDGHYNIDTISMETLTEELGLPDENKTMMPAEKKTAAAKGVATPANAGTNNNSVAANENAEGTTASANPQILPGASASANGKPAMGQKENTVSKQSSGASALANLSATFNDIKNTASGVQFAAGLKGGINGTFFGPSSFNGFQLGVTGDFIFGNDWSFTTELEYFHRINNNYSLADNYYSYTPINGGASGYNKEQEQNLYSFSTLHSIEMPLIIKYSAGNFNVFVGGNLVYIFSINTGAAPQPPTGNITYSPTQGNDNVPKLNAADFDSRFGVGCLFGVSYKVAPNVTIDLRNVMTLWDNANSQGAKYVSDQLYKSPSLQLSLGYRLGGHKQNN